jgi:prephenate dehydratase
MNNPMSEDQYHVIASISAFSKNKSLNNSMMLISLSTFLSERMHNFIKENISMPKIESKEIKKKYNF